MIRTLSVIRGRGTDPFRNLALESALLESVSDGQMILYLWQNRDTVVIGRNQNIWKECNMTEIRKDGVTVVRRPSGGGAVFHDLGNLNFTFVARDGDYDETRQTEVILNAVRSCGISAERSGRNDLLAEGGKFSGNAYYHSRGASFHHGTLLVRSDLSRIAKYLNPDPLKLKSHGVDSVHSRVTNLSEFRSDLTVDEVQDALIRAFETEYVLKSGLCPEPDPEQVAELEDILRSTDWLYGRNPGFDKLLENRFPWGGIRMEFRVQNGRICSVQVWTDAMDHTLPEKLGNALLGKLYLHQDMAQSIRKIGNDPVIRDISTWILEEERYICNLT